MRAYVATTLLTVTLAAPPLFAQGGGVQHQHPAPQSGQPGKTPPEAQTQSPHAGHDAAGMELFAAREASGTAWAPDATPMYGVERQTGPWTLMLHGNAFAQFLNENGDRGSQQGGSINWGMVMARRRSGQGRFGLRGMFSLEPWTIPGCGYPDLLASGEQCEGEPIHDRQHPHDMFMELAAEYARPVLASLQWHLYSGLAGEPALGPPAYPHRASAMPNPIAPISHHWLDSTHIVFGVVTTGLSSRSWKIEGSMFNGREPDEHRADLDLAALDSFSGRVWFLPTPRLALQVSAAHLSEAEAGHGLDPRADVDRVTASLSHQAAIGRDWQWASTAAFGRNKEAGEATSALLLETSLTLREHDTWFGRIEWTAKPASDLELGARTTVHDLVKAQLGYAAYFAVGRHMTAGFGGSISAGVVPPALTPFYGRRVNTGMALFLTVRPSAHHSGH